MPKPIAGRSLNTSFSWRLPKPYSHFAAHGKSVQWKLGADGDIWVWVMGEHSLDKPYELLCAEILAQRVRHQSMQEAEAVR